MTQVNPSYYGNADSANAMSQSTVAELLVVPSLEPAVRTADAAGGWVDLKDYEAAEVVHQFGAHGDTLSSTDKIACTIEESDDGVTSLGAVAAADLVGTLKTATANSDCDKVYAVGYRGKHRYIRASLDFSGTHSSGTATAAVVILGYGRHMPTAGVGAALAVGS